MRRGMVLATVIALVGCASEESEPEPAAGAETVAATPTVALVLGRDSRESNSSVDETRLTPVKITWRDGRDGPLERTVMELRSGEGEGAGSFASLDDLEWPEAVALLRSARPAGTTHTLFFDQGHWGWLGLHLVPEGDSVRIVAQRYDELSVLGTTEATFELHAGPGELLDPPPPR